VPEDYAWLMEAAGGVPVIEYCGGTEIGGGCLIDTVLHDAVPAMFTTPTLGLDVRILDEEGQPADEGELFVVPPSIGLSQELLVRDHRAIYYEGLPRSDVPLRRHGDHMERLPGGYYHALGRVDDTMNLGGIKISSAEIERAVGGIEGIAEIAAVAVSPPGGGPSRLVVYTVPSEGADANPEAWKRDMQQALRSDLNPLFRIEAVVVIDELPRTAFAKVMRRDLREASAPMNPLVVLRNEDMAPPGYLGDAFDRRGVGCRRRLLLEAGSWQPVAHPPLLSYSPPAAQTRRVPPRRGPSSRGLTAPCKGTATVGTRSWRLRYSVAPS
jgi:acyl-coenzyme A synthetase/AMP-(fatty) acid ligase